MKLLLMLSMVLICGCGNPYPEGTAVTDFKGSLLIKINDEGANFNIYKFQYEGNEYIIVAGVNGNAIVKK